MISRPFLLIVFLAGCFGPKPFAVAAEIHSNGLGGGKWSSADTWEEKRVPTAVDVVVIASNDTVTFDRDDSASDTCTSLLLDPEARLEFESGMGKRVLRLGGSIEAYGHLRLDGTQAPTDQLEIWLVGKSPRRVTLLKGGGLILSGYPNLPEERRNVVVKSLEEKPDWPTAPASLDAGTRSSLDIQNARLENLAITAQNINNTGIRPNERLNFMGSLFVNSQITLRKCDTPRIAGNVFTARKGPGQAISLQSSPLAEIQRNRISGYSEGISHQGEEIMLLDNVIEACGKGIRYVGNPNAMIRGGRIAGCTMGVEMHEAGGVIEDLEIANCLTGIHSYRSNFQVNNVRFNELPAKGQALNLGQSGATLLNCNVRPEQVKHAESGATALHYVIVKVNGKLPADALVSLRPVADSPDGTPAPEARNSPAPLRDDGLTPLPASLGALEVRVWQINREGKLLPAPTYRLSIGQPSADGSFKELKSMTLPAEATEFRENLSSEKPTLELNL